MLFELINYDCICEIVKNLSIKYWNNFRLTSQYTKDITNFITISKLNCTIDIDMGSRKINGKTIPIHYVGEYIHYHSKYTKIKKKITYRHGLGILTIPTAQKSQNIYKGNFSYNRLKNHVLVYKRTRKPKDTIVNHYYDKNDIENRINYSGDWLNGNPHGVGIMTKKIGRLYYSYKGTWKHGIKDSVFEEKHSINNTRIICYNTYKNNIKQDTQIIYVRTPLITYNPYKWTYKFTIKIKDRDKTIMEHIFETKYCTCIFISFYGDDKKIINPLEFDHSRCNCTLCKHLSRFKSNTI